MNVATLRVIITCAGLAIITAARAIAPENNVIITKLEAAYTIEADCSSAAICVRAELKAQMKDWLAEKLGVDDEKKLLIANRKYLATCMAELVYEETVRPY